MSQGLPGLAFVKTKPNKYGVPALKSDQLGQISAGRLIKKHLTGETPEEMWSRNLGNLSPQQRQLAGVFGKDFASQYVLMVILDGWWVIREDKLDDVLARAKLMDKLSLMRYVGEYHLIELIPLFQLYGETIHFEYNIRGKW